MYQRQELREVLNKLSVSLTEMALSILNADSGKFYNLDFLHLAGIHRSLSNISAFIQLMDGGNYFAAIPFLRMQIDTVLRFHASRIVDDPQEFSQKVLEGISVRKLKDRSGKNMTDRYLVESLACKEPWLTAVYESGSGFVHLSNKHMFGLFGNEIDEGGFSLLIGPTHPNIPEHMKAEAFAAMAHISELIMHFASGWLREKSKA